MPRTSTRNALLAALLLVGCGGPTSNGPLNIGRGVGETVTGMNAHVGQRVAFGETVARNEGAAPITLTGARLLPMAEGQAVHLVDVQVVDISDGGTIFPIGEWPTPEVRPFEDIDGYTIRPGGRVEVVFVLDVRGEGYWRYDGAVVEYRYGRAAYSATAARGLRLCVPARAACT